MSDNIKDKLLNEREAAEVLAVKPQTLTLWRSTGRYPLPYVKVGNAVRYRMSDLEAFINAGKVVPFNTIKE